MGWVLLVLLGAFVVDRLALAAERRGWIYWRHRRATTTSGGNALVALQAILEPSKEHTIAEEVREASDVDVADDDEPATGH